MTPFNFGVQVGLRDQGTIECEVRRNKPCVACVSRDLEEMMLRFNLSPPRREDLHVRIINEVRIDHQPTLWSGADGGGMAAISCGPDWIGVGLPSGAFNFPADCDQRVHGVQGTPVGGRPVLLQRQKSARLRSASIGTIGALCDCTPSVGSWMLTSRRLLLCRSP